MEWYGHNCFEISFESIKKITTGYDLDTVKEKIYDEVKAIDEVSDIGPKTVCAVLDSFYVTTYFSSQYKIYKDTLDKDFELKTSFLIDAVLGHIISYELVIPDKILQTNAPIINSDTLVWKVDGMRLLFDNYTLTAEYRVINSWAFVLSGLIIIIAVGGIGFRIVRKRISRKKSIYA